MQFRSLPLAVFAALATALGASAQQVVLPIDDLVAKPASPNSGAGWIGHLGRLHREVMGPPGLPYPGFIGESELLSQPPDQPWFVADELQELLSGLGRGDLDSMRVDSGLLVSSTAREPQLRESLAWIRRRLPEGIRLTFDLTRGEGADAETLLAGVEAVRGGSTARFDDTVSRTIVRDFDVEIASGSAVANPIVRHQSVGSCLAVRIRTLPKDESVLLELVARVGDDVEGAEQVIPVGDADCRGLDRAARDIAELGAAFIVARGETEKHEWTGRNGERYKLTLSVDWDPRPSPLVAGVSMRVGSALAGSVLSFRNRVGLGQMQDEDEIESALLAAAENVNPLGLVEAVGAERLLAGRTPESVPKLVMIGAAAPQLDDRLQDLAAQRLVRTRTELVLLDIPMGAEIDASAVGEAGRPAGSRELARVSGAVLTDHWSSFAGRREQAYIEDWDVEVAQNSRVPDPKVHYVTDGYTIDVRPERGGDGRVARLVLSGEFARVDRIEARETQLGAAWVAAGSSSQSSATQSMMLPALKVPVEAPIRRRQPLTMRLGLDKDGAAVWRRSAPRLLGKGRELVVIARSAIVGR